MRLNLIYTCAAAAMLALLSTCAHDTEWLSRMEYDILSVNIDEDYFVIDGNHAAEFKVEGEIEVIISDAQGDPETLGPYEVESAVVTLNGTRVTITGSIPDEDFVGAIMVHVTDADNEPDPEEILIEFTTRGPFTSDVWYYLVFNFSQAKGTTVDANTVPAATISGDERGENWEMYVLVHQEEGGNTELSTLQTERLPTVIGSTLGVAAGPVDTATGQLTGDSLVDVAIASPSDGVVQVLPAFQVEPDDLDERKYWDEAYDVPDSIASAGNAPIRVHCDDLNGDDIDDLLVLYANESAGTGFLRILLGDDAGSDGNHDGTFTEQGTDIQLEMLPVDWVPYDVDEDEILDLNDDDLPDIAVLGSTGTTGRVMVFNGVDGGGFDTPVSVSTAANPVAIAAGILADTSIDFAVASNSGTGGNGVIQVLQDQGAAAHVSVLSLDVGGPVQSVAISKMFGAAKDIVATYNTADEGNVIIFHNEESAFFTETADVLSWNGSAYGVLPFDSNNDNYTDLVVTDGVPGEENHSLYIIHRDSSRPTSFNLDPDIITYLMGTSPGRINLTDLDGDTKRDDFTIPNSHVNASSNEGGDSVNLVYGQGKSNYTNAQRYWIDFEPVSLTLQPWYKRHVLGPNSFSLVIDPLVFYDMTLTEVDSFVLDIMTAESAIDFDRNFADGVRQDSLVWEHMSVPIGVNVQVDYLEDENHANRTLEEPSDPAQDIDFWKIEVI